MVFFTEPMLLLMTLTLLSAEDTDYLEVLYPQATITPAISSSAKLSCTANYDYEKCGLVHVMWHKMAEDSDRSTELIDPKKYPTTVSEVFAENNMRQRHVLTEIIDVIKKDRGRYQCKAECDTGEQAMGHFITINVKGRSTA